MADLVKGVFELGSILLRLPVVALGNTLGHIWRPKKDVSKDVVLVVRRCCCVWRAPRSSPFC